MASNVRQTAGRERVTALAVFLGVTFGAMALVSLPVSRFLPAPLRRILPVEGWGLQDSFLSPSRGITLGQAQDADEVLDRLLGSLERTVVEVTFPDGSTGSSGVGGGIVAGPPTDGGRPRSGDGDGGGGSGGGLVPDPGGDGGGRPPAGPDSGDGDGDGDGGHGRDDAMVVRDGHGRNWTGVHHADPKPRIKGRWGSHGPEGSGGQGDGDGRAGSHGHGSRRDRSR